MSREDLHLQHFTIECNTAFTTQMTRILYTRIAALLFLHRVLSIAQPPRCSRAAVGAVPGITDMTGLDRSATKEGQKVVRDIAVTC